MPWEITIWYSSIKKKMFSIRGMCQQSSSPSGKTRTRQYHFLSQRQPTEGHQQHQQQVSTISFSQFLFKAVHFTRRRSSKVHAQRRQLLSHSCSDPIPRTTLMTTLSPPPSTLLITYFLHLQPPGWAIPVGAGVGWISPGRVLPVVEVVLVLRPVPRQTLLPFSTTTWALPALKCQWAMLLVAPQTSLPAPPSASVRSIWMGDQVAQTALNAKWFSTLPEWEH